MGAAVKEVEVKERPIIFSGPMVKAIVEGRKTQTRRVLDSKWFELSETSGHLRYKEYDPPRWHQGDSDGNGRYLAGSGPFDPKKQSDQRHAASFCRYGNKGDRLWVRETWADADCMYQSHANDVPGTIAYFADKSAIQYDLKIPRQVGVVDLASWNWNVLKRRPSIFMPRWASRITLEITNVRVERLQSISDEDAKAEGVDQAPYSPNRIWIANPANSQRYIKTFRKGWDALNAKRGYSWESNCFVWVIEFRKL